VSNIPAFKKAVVGGGERETQCTSKLQVVESDTTCTSYRQLLMVLSLLYDIEKSYVNAGMPNKR
jgi:hypothetical protein